jgi:catechol 2,3-dioxygenase-like lactoylglutathione lyase family enzyme
VLDAAPTHATLPAADLERAKRFYAEKLGLQPTREMPGGLFYESDTGRRFVVFPTTGRASGAHTQMGWTVDDIEASVAELRSRGVSFEEYDYPDLRTVDGIAQTGPVRAAWFRDSEDNLLGLIQFS